MRDLARTTGELAVLIEKEWKNFSPEARNLIEAVIYKSIAKHNGIRGIISTLRVRLSLAWVLIKGETDALIEYLNALQRLQSSCTQCNRNRAS